MKNHIILLIIIILFPTMSFANKPQESLNSKITQILANFGENINIGILVKDVNNNKILYQKNSDRYFMPASNEKLFTAFSALHYLSPTFTYQTNLYTDANKIQNGVLNDNVYLVFSGDPTLTFAQIDHLMSSLTQKKITHINGNIIVDDTDFDQVTMSPGTTWDDQNTCYGSPIKALIIDHNCVSVTLTPAAKPQQRATLTMPDHPQFMRFINHVVTNAPTAQDCKVAFKSLNDNTYLISGCIKTTDAPSTIMMATSNPRSYLQTLLTYLLNKNHISLKGAIQFNKLDKSQPLFASETSPPLAELVKTMLKESDNTIANTLFKTLGAVYAKQPGSWDNGSQAVHDILMSSIHLDISTTTLIDGAGGSRYDYVTPQQIITLLTKVYHSSHATQFISALPISGVDGTLKDRMKNPETIGKVRAKTGTETAVTTLSGFIETRKKHTIAFSIMINGFIDTPTKYKALEDKICTALIQNA